MQFLHDETRAALNALVDELGGEGAAAALGAVAPEGLSGSTVQAVLNELAAAMGSMGGSVQIDGGTLAQLVAAAVERDILGGYYTAPQVEEKLSQLGVTGLEQRMGNMENALSADGVVLGEVNRTYPFTLPAAELAGAEEFFAPARSNVISTGGELVSLAAVEGAMRLTRVKPETGEVSHLSLTGDVLPMNETSLSFVPHWTDGSYVILKAAAAWYLLSIETGACVRLVSGTEYSFCGAARIGNIITAVFHNEGSLYFYRRSTAGDSGRQPALTALDTYTESGSAMDRVLNVYGGVFVMLKYGASDSKLKVYEPSEMLGSAEFSTGLAAARAVCARPDGENCWCVIETESGSYPARCRLAAGSTFSAPAITRGSAGAGERIVGKKDTVIYAAQGKTLYKLGCETMATLGTLTLPAEVPASAVSLEGGKMSELWGGKYVLTGDRLLDVENMKYLALRCDGATPEAYAVLPAAERCFAARAKGRWYMFDSLLRPVWGMVPYVAGEQPDENEEPRANTSAFGAMNKV